MVIGDSFSSIFSAWGLPSLIASRSGAIVLLTALGTLPLSNPNPDPNSNPNPTPTPNQVPELETGRRAYLSRQRVLVRGQPTVWPEARAINDL